MAVESYLVTALPYSADPDAPFHVSLFVTHRLTPDDPAGGVLGDFPITAAWGDNVEAADVTLTNGAGSPIPVTVVPQVRPALWPQVFPRDLAVRGFPVPELADAPWRSFPASRMDGYARGIHTLAALLSPVAPPAIVDALLPLVAGSRQHGAVDLSDRWERDRPPGRRELKELFETLLDRQTGRLGANDPRGRSPLRQLELLDELLTAQLDELTQGGTRAPTVEQPLQQVLVDLHLARRYYERPEEQRPYHERPDPDAATTPPPARPDPDFHQRCSLLADTPGILRALGLVVDVRVDHLGALQGIDAIQGDIRVDGLENPVHVQPYVTCHRSGTRFTTVSSTGDHVHGALRLGDPDRYQVLDLDPDASGLKLERFVRSLPRVIWSALNGDAATGAPAALRSSGFSIARVDGPSQLRERLTGARHRDEELLTGHVPSLATEDVVRGVRLEVWDDASGDWRSLHQRLLDVEVDGVEVVTDQPDVGFLQGAALTRADEAVSDDPDRPYHAHEVLAGWEGWSLSVPPVGKVVTEEPEPVDQPDDDRVTPLATVAKPMPGTLPWLRYGRSYAFRAWTVDLAGNSPPASVPAATPPPTPPARGRAAARPAGGQAISDRARTAAADRVAAIAADRGRIAPGFSAVEATLRDGLLGSLPLRRAAEVSDVPPLADLAPTGEASIDATVRARLADRRAATVAGLTRTARIETAVTEVAAVEPRLLVATSETAPLGALADAVTSATAVSFGRDAVADLRVVEDVASTVTAPRPFLRWDPVLPPAVVPRHAYSEGESLHTLVVRSGVELTDGEILRTDPATYADQTRASHPDLVWRADSQRHLAPPKTSQQEAERHGRFDAAFGPSGTATTRRRALATSLREAGTFLDRTVAHPTKPGERVDQPGVELHHQPQADPEGFVTLDDVDAQRGTALGSGQYVAHDVAKLRLPYLADPLADGASLVFPDAGRDHRLTVPFAIEGVRLPYLDDWPDQVPHRLVLTGGDELTARVDGHVVTVSVPPGERLRIRLASSLRADDLELLGLWRGLPAAFRARPEIADAARDGWLWWLTPAEDLQLVHAVPRPVDRPRIATLLPLRLPGATEVALLGVVDVHGPSTGRLDVEAAWSEPVDDPAKEAPDDDPPLHRTGIAGDTEVAYEEDLVLFGPAATAGQTLPVGGGATIRVHAASQVFEDTKHRVVDYTVRATTRYREFFDPAVTPTVDDLSLVSEPQRVSIPSSARPPKPVVRDVLPLFRWDERGEPEQPFGLRRTRRSGLRLYLDRPWYATGEGELLGVVLSAGSPATRPWVSQWAADPVWRQDGPTSDTTLPLLDVFHLLAKDGREVPGRPVGPATSHPQVDLPGSPQVQVLGYRPEFHPDRQLWAVDVAFDPGTAFWPFVRLAVVRYQPASLPGLHLSPVVVCDFTQLTPERTATLTRPDADSVRVIVTGAVGERGGGLELDPGGRVAPDRVVLARLERRDPDLDSDLAWVTRAVRVLPVRGRQGAVVSWNGTLPLGTPLPPRRPGEHQDWRVTVEEWETLPADGPTLHTTGRESRLVYADHLPL